MSVSSGFFNSVNGDRVYNADDIANYFEGLLTNGVFYGYGTGLGVFENPAGADMSVVVGTGKAMALGKFIKNTNQLTLELETGGSQPRYDAIVAGVDLDARTADIYVKQGTEAVSPAYPSRYNNVDTVELVLAYVYVAAGATSIVQSNITQKQSDSSVCGWITFTNLTPNFQIYRNDVTITANNTTTVSIGIPAYDASSDMLIVLLNGVMMIPVTEYMISGSGSSAKVALTTKITTGSNKNVMTFIVYQVSTS